jgi:hypothetical protein
MWSAAFIQALDERASGNPFKAELIKSRLQTGFPWHTPEESWADHVDRHRVTGGEPPRAPGA